MADDETFGSENPLINETLEAGQIRKGGYIMIKGNPCKVMDVSRSESGKGGHNVCHFVALDIFSGEKMEDDMPVSHFPGVPFVKKMEYKAMKVDDDDYITVLTDDGDTRPIKVSPVALELSNKIKEMLKKEIDFYVIVQQACGKEQIMDIKIAASGGSGVDFFDDKD